MFITIGTEFYYANRNTKTAEKCVAVMVRSGYPSTIYAKKESGEDSDCSECIFGQDEDICHLQDLQISGGNNGWIPIDEKLPPDESYILLSFSNYSVPIVGRYEEDEDGGGNFFAGDEDEPLISQDMYVNAWMALPKPYEEK